MLRVCGAECVSGDECVQYKRVFSNSRTECVQYEDVCEWLCVNSQVECVQAPAVAVDRVKCAEYKGVYIFTLGLSVCNGVRVCPVWRLVLSV